MFISVLRKKMREKMKKTILYFGWFKKTAFFSLWVFSFFIPTPVFAITGDITPCFTPGGNCAQMIIDEINHENNSILVQAYQLTSADIAKALVEAKRRGVMVKIILDKTQYTQKRYSAATFFDHAGIPVWIDVKPAIAHNKIIILGNSNEVITGSYNYSKNAEYKNAENVLIIKSKDLAKIYTQNFQKRLSASIELSRYEKMKNDKLLSSTNQKNNHRSHKGDNSLNKLLFG
jgi:phosphatidylserine/phosphatidylglycerophosphate/cardiolipin synthase-like enzyme